MDIYNMKPAWIAVMEETSRELGRELTGEEIEKIYWKTKTYAQVLGSMYSRYLGINGKENDDAVNGMISDLIMEGLGTED